MSRSIKAKKKFGQNFLIDKNIIEKIINISEVQNQSIIEIGPGQGALTEKLVQLAKDVEAYEIDNDMIEILQQKIQANNFKLQHQDFLEANFEWNGKKKIVANLPYYITSQILFKIFEHVSMFSSITIMVQNEVANRLAAKVNTSDYGKLSIAAQHFATIKKHFTVSPESFQPIPKVTSAVITLTFDKKISLNSEKFLYFIKKSFAMKRKTLINNWKQFIAEDKIYQTFERFNLNKNIRPQEISVEVYQSIFESWGENV
ncbi:16S rRNA (adenine(1518)-N(6)/adenine(1519)-N(6))-dimethyltransferase RsmA [Candidatus Mycoplasma pogonae]